MVSEPVTPGQYHLATNDLAEVFVVRPSATHDGRMVAFGVYEHSDGLWRMGTWQLDGRFFHAEDCEESILDLIERLPVVQSAFSNPPEDLPLFHNPESLHD